MISHKFKLLTFIFLFLLTDLFSEKINTSIKFDTNEQSAWTISHNFIGISDYSEAIIIPFNYPFEASLLPSLPETKNSKGKVFEQTYKLNLFSDFFGNSSKVIFTPSENSEIITYKASILNDNAHYARDRNSRLPNLWHRSSPMINTSSGVVFAYLKKNMGLNLDLSFRMAGNNAGHAIFESLISKITFSYKLSNKIFDMNPNYRLNMVLQVSNIQYFDERAIPKKLDFAKANSKSQFLSSGFTLNAKSVMFEGLIRVPIQQQPVFDLDGLLRPELQGRLGMKWHLPEYIQP